jgi:hypothetical protein
LPCLSFIATIHASHSSTVFLFPMSVTVGVGSNDEQSGSLVRRAGVGSSYNPPVDAVPQAGKVRNHFFATEGEMSSDVLQDDVAGS